eukprot:scaffold146913_cov17-Tisochrysis_lutea.AAC.1
MQAAASAEEDYAADWILGSSSYYFASTPAPMQPPPAPSALQPFPPEVGPVALSGPASPRHSLTQGGAACSHGERMVLIHLASSDSGGNTGQDSGSAWSKEDDEDMRAEEQVADSPTGSQQQQQQQQEQHQQQHQQHGDSFGEQMQGGGGSSGSGGDALPGLLASMVALEQERDALAARVLDTGGCCSVTPCCCSCRGLLLQPAAAV